MVLLCLILAVMCLLFPSAAAAVWGLILLKVWWRNHS